MGCIDGQQQLTWEAQATFDTKTVGLAIQQVCRRSDVAGPLGHPVGQTDDPLLRLTCRRDRIVRLVGGKPGSGDLLVVTGCNATEHHAVFECLEDRGHTL